MALQSSGAISLGDIRDEFGGAGARAISTYYRGGGLVPNHEQNSDIPTSSTITFSDFYSTAKDFEASLTSGVGASTIGYIDGTHGSMNFTFVGKSASVTTQVEIISIYDLEVKGTYSTTLFVVNGNHTGTWWSSIVISGSTAGTNTFTRPDSGTYNSGPDTTSWTVNDGPYFFSTEVHSVTLSLA